MSKKQREELKRRLKEIESVHGNPDELFDLYEGLKTYLQGVLDLEED